MCFKLSKLINTKITRFKKNYRKITIKNQKKSIKICYLVII